MTFLAGGEFAIHNSLLVLHLFFMWVEHDYFCCQAALYKPDFYVSVLFVEASERSNSKFTQVPL